MGLLDAVLSPNLLMSSLPTPAKLYIDSVLMRKKEPITEADFTPAELAAIRKLTEQQVGDRGGIHYGNYSESDQPGISSLLSPAGRIANSLGQFGYQRDPEGTTVTDNYDFNAVYKDEPLLLKAMSILGSGGFSGAHMLGEYMLPPGSGRPVRIRLPNR